MIGRTGNYRMAVTALRSNRWRSLLTMLGIIIGVVSVVTTVSLGEGAKRGVVDQINKSGSDLITVRPGASVETSSQSVNLFGASYSGTLSEKDLQTVESVPGTRKIVPFSYVSNVMT